MGRKAKGDNTIVPPIAASDNLPTYYKYRYTYDLSASLQTQITLANQFLAEIRHYMLLPKYTLGIEHYTKGMQPCKPHLHIHFVSKHSSKNIREQLRTKFGLIGRVQSCKAEVNVDEFKFWRYPLKQQSGESKRFFRTEGFSKEDEKHYLDVAYACWKQAAEVSISKQQRKEERSSKDRLFTYLDETFEDSATLRDYRIAAYRYYVEHEDTFSPSSIRGYVYMYVLRRGIISYEDFDSLPI